MTPDFESMQAQAIKYAQEMQKKSTVNTQHRVTENNADFRKKDETCTRTQSYDRNRTGFRRQSGIKNMFNVKDEKNDNDIMIILVLLLLLTQDGGDKMLMLALMYIMT